MDHEHKKFDIELSDLRTKLNKMGDLVIAQIDAALACLSEHDVRGTRPIIESDIDVNRMDIDLEQTCLQFLALHQPVAGDLRLITATMKITTELERIGDRVVNLCEAVHDRDESARPRDGSRQPDGLCSGGQFACSTSVREGQGV